MNILEKQLQEVSAQYADCVYSLKDIIKSYTEKDTELTTLLKYKNYWLTTAYKSNPPLWHETVDKLHADVMRLKTWIDTETEMKEKLSEQFKVLQSKLAADNVSKYEFINEDCSFHIIPQPTGIQTQMF